MRSAIFFYNKHRIEEINKKELANGASYELALNHLADISLVELKARNGFKLPKEQKLLAKVRRNTPEAQKYLDSILQDKTNEVPDSVDWRTVPGRVSPVKDQGDCGSCWAFSAVGALEGQEFSKSKKNGWTSEDLTQLSEQNLIDCTKSDQGCNGGIMQDAFEQVRMEDGIDSEASYPYEAKTGKCRYNKTQAVISDIGYIMLPEGDENSLKEVVALVGPVSVAIDASDMDFAFYHHGIFHGKDCKNTIDHLDHAVLVVGYGTDKTGGDYWIVKNSWAANWGEKGYIRMARNRSNNCGIATNAVIPFLP